MAIALFGGSFDPIHRGHILVIKKTLSSLPIKKLIVMPAWLNPHKNNSFAPPSLRTKWVKKSLFIISKKIEVSTYEIDQNRAVRTIETIRALKQKYGKIYLIIGSDTLAKLPTWKEYRRLRQEVTIVVASRKGSCQRHPYKRLKISSPISSTQVRKRVSRNFLPSCVAKEIQNYYKGIK